MRGISSSSLLPGISGISGPSNLKMSQGFGGQNMRWPEHPLGRVVTTNLIAHVYFRGRHIVKTNVL